MHLYPKHLLWLVLAPLLLSGCDNASVAFCSGSDEFCNDFFTATLAEKEEEEASENAVDPVVAALAVANETPSAITTAIALQTMDELVQQEADLVGLWLSAATLGHLHAPDNLTISEFLDQNRAWLTEQQTAPKSTSLAVGLNLFAAFAAERDPALAKLATTNLAVTVTSTAAQNTVREEAHEILRSTELDACCQAAELAAAAIVLCATTTLDNESLDGPVKEACVSAENWLIGTLRLAEPQPTAPQMEANRFQ
jgi:hypothetical protein